MPEFFPFIPGTETSTAASRLHGIDSTSPLLGRFRAVPPRTTPSSNFSIFAPQRHHGSSRLSEARRLSLLAASNRGSVHVGYGALIAAGLDDGGGDGESEEDWSSDEDDDADGGGGGGHKGYRMTRIWRRTVKKTRRNVEDLWVAPRHNAVSRVVETWWSRWGLLVFFPAVLVSCFCVFADRRRGIYRQGRR